MIIHRPPFAKHGIVLLIVGKIDFSVKKRFFWSFFLQPDVYESSANLRFCRSGIHYISLIQPANGETLQQREHLVGRQRHHLSVERYSYFPTGQLILSFILNNSWKLFNSIINIVDNFIFKQSRQVVSYYATVDNSYRSFAFDQHFRNFVHNTVLG